MDGVSPLTASDASSPSRLNINALRRDAALPQLNKLKSADAGNIKKRGKNACPAEAPWLLEWVKWIIGVIIMALGSKFSAILAITAVFGLSACGGGSGSVGSGNFSGGSASSVSSSKAKAAKQAKKTEKRETIWGLFQNRDDPNTTVEVNKYIWNAALEVLNFLPIQAADPFTGVIVTGYGTPPGGRRAYKATIYVQDPALDARSLSIALRTRSGVASADTVRAIEDAILTRARQLRIRDSKL